MLLSPSHGGGAGSSGWSPRERRRPPPCSPQAKPVTLACHCSPWVLSAGGSGITQGMGQRGPILRDPENERGGRKPSDAKKLREAVDGVGRGGVGRGSGGKQVALRWETEQMSPAAVNSRDRLSSADTGLWDRALLLPAPCALPLATLVHVARGGNGEDPQKVRPGSPRETPPLPRPCDPGPQ